MLESSYRDVFECTLDCGEPSLRSSCRNDDNALSRTQVSYDFRSQWVFFGFPARAVYWEYKLHFIWTCAIKTCEVLKTSQVLTKLESNSFSYWLDTAKAVLLRLGRNKSNVKYWQKNQRLQYQQWRNARLGLSCHR
jgi:hypothetical protein